MRMKKQAEADHIIHTSVDNESAELVKMACTNCGAPLAIVDKTHAKCPFCGQTYLIDEAKGIVVNVSVDYGDSGEIKQSVKKTQRMIIGFFIAALLVTAIIFAVNLAANKSAFSSSDSDAPVEENGDLLVIFCKDIFQKEYRDITPEEFAGIRYLKYDYQKDERTGEYYHTISYSFTNYEDCASEEEFSDTVQSWSYESSKANSPSNFTMLTGLTRIDTTGTTWLSLLHYAEDCKISYIATDDSLEVVTSKVNPAYVKVLDMGTFGSNLKGLEQYENLEALKAKNPSRFNTAELTGIKNCSKLKKLELDCAEAYEGMEEIAELPELVSLSIKGATLSDCDFLKKIPRLEKLTIDVGEASDLSMLSYLPNLKKLDIGDDTVDTIEPVLALTRLEDLTISVDTSENMELLAELKQLKALRLHTSYWEMDENHHNKPLDLSVFSRLPELESLYVSLFSNGKISGAESVLNMPGLKSFGVSLVLGDFMIDPEQLAENASLEIFGLERAGICSGETGEAGDLSFLSHYPNLRELWIQHCDLEDIAFVTQLKNIERCDFEGNDITDYSPLKECKKLEYLCVGNSSLEERPDVAEGVEVDYGWHEFKDR